MDHVSENKLKIPVYHPSFIITPILLIFHLTQNNWLLKFKNYIYAKDKVITISQVKTTTSYNMLVWYLNIIFLCIFIISSQNRNQFPKKWLHDAIWSTTNCFISEDDSSWYIPVKNCFQIVLSHLAMTNREEVIKCRLTSLSSHPHFHPRSPLSIHEQISYWLLPIPLFLPLSLRQWLMVMERQKQ